MALVTHLYLIPIAQLFYMTKFYMPSVKVEVRTTLCAVQIDDQIERRLVAKIHTYGNYGHVQVCSHSETP